MVSVPDSILPGLRLGDQPVAEQGDFRTKDARLRVDDVIGEGRRQHDIEQADEATVGNVAGEQRRARSEEHTSELQSLMRSSYAVFCLTNKTQHLITHKPY